MLHRQEAELALRAGAEALSGEAAGADRDLRLPHLISRAEHVRLGIQERADPLLLVVREDEPPDAGEEGHGDEERDPCLPGKPAEEERHAEKRKERRRQSRVGLEEDEKEGDRDDRPDLRNGGALHPGVVLVLEEVREKKRRRHLRQLCRLELEPSDPDPRLHVRDPLAEKEEVDERDQAHAVDDEGELQQHPVVEEDGGDHRAQSDENPDRLPGCQALEAPALGRRGDEQDAEHREGDRASQDDQVEPPRDR